MICAQVTSSNLDQETREATFKLLNKLLQLKRCLAFLLLYYENIQLEHILVVLFGRFNDPQHHRSPEYIITERCLTIHFQ